MQGEVQPIRHFDEGFTRLWERVRSSLRSPSAAMRHI